MTSPAIRKLPKDLQEIAIKDLNEVPERIPEDLKILKTWIDQQPYLNARTDDQLLISFLRGCKYSLEKAKSKIDKYYTLRTKFPNFFGLQEFNIDKLLNLLRTGVLLFLPTPLNENGPRIGIMRMGAIPPENYKIEDVMLLGLRMQEITLLEDDYSIVNGVVFIMDMANATATHLVQMSPTFAKKMSTWNEEATPLRPKSNHFINGPTGFETIFNMIKPMMSKKMQNRLYVHGNKMELLYKQIPMKYLPKEYGGSNGAIEEIIKYWENRLLSYVAYFKEEVKYGVDEKLKPGEPIDYENIFGIDGSFRKINVD